MAPELQDHIGHHLRAAYTELVQEPIPKGILKVLDELKAKEKSGKSEGSGS